MWEDAAEGRVLLTFCTADGLEGVVSSPQGRVPKINPDRTIAPEGRFITNMREPNKGCSKEYHPPPLSLATGR